MTETKLPKAPRGQTQRQRADAVEPDCLIEHRFDREGPRCGSFAPRAVNVDRGDTEDVVSRRQMRVDRLSMIACVDPLAVESFEAVPETRPPRRRQVED